MIQNRDLLRQHETLRDEIDVALAEVMNSGRFVSGPSVVELEHELASYVGVKHCVTCGNGTDALTLALMAWDIGEGDAVFVPDFTFFASGEAPAFLGAQPVFVDVDKNTYNLDVEKLEQAIVAVKKEGKLTPRVVVSVDLFGLPADYVFLREVCEREGLLLLEDGAQGFGGSIGIQRACSFGDIAITSFFPAKPLGCYGDGGALFTDSDEWAGLLRSLAVHGKGSMKYDNVRIGMNSRLDTMQAAILRVKLKAFIEYELDAINKVAGWYDAALQESPLVLPSVPEGFRSSWAQYTVQLPQGTNRDALQLALKQQGIATMVYYPKTMHRQCVFKNEKVCYGSCSVADELASNVLSLPIHPYCEQEEVELVAEKLLEHMRPVR